MKVKQLDWVENVNKTYINSESRQFYILYPNHQSFLRQNTNYEAIETFFDGCKATKLIGNFKTLEQAKQACQDHFESFILSQVENEVKPFDPTLLGFKASHNYPLDPQDKFYFKKDFALKCKRSYWSLHYDNGLLFDGFKIPDHDFGVKLLSQFLGVE